MKYRSEIDGLRAIAVIPVILFHAGFEYFSAGFIGVDIFFVISGYLITTILIQELDLDHFSILNFYERRARRILPALFFVMLSTIPFAWCFMMPHQMKDYSLSLIGVSLFVSNIQFWRESGYFDQVAEEKPLLHTWSLAVEEQYYVFFPIFLFLIWHFGRQKVFWIVALFVLMSLSASEWGWRVSPSANFYLAPSRAWELLAGSIVAFVVCKYGVKTDNIKSLVGLFAIILSFIVYDENTPFPSLYACLPIAGVMLILMYASSQTWVSKILSLKLIVGIGLISYSAYLWHQPLFVFARLVSEKEPTLEIMSGLAALSLLLAYVSWKYVEIPFRSRNRISRVTVFKLSCFGIFFFTLIGFVGYILNGFDYRYSDGQKNIASLLSYPHEIAYLEGSCFLRPDQFASDYDRNCIKNGKYIVWGDSHAAALASGWRELDPDIGQITASACPPVLNYNPPNRTRCADINDSFFKIISDYPNRTIILHADWEKYVGNNVLEKLDNTFKFLKQAGFKSIVVIGGTPSYQKPLPSILLESGVDILDSQKYVPTNQVDIRKADQYLNTVVRRNNISFVPLIDYLCAPNQCLAVFVEDGKFYLTHWDKDHLTIEGAAFIYQTYLKKHIK